MVTPGGWTEWVDGTANGRRFQVRFRLLHLSADGKSLALLMSAGCSMDTISDPPELGAMLLSRLGPYSHGTAIPPRPDDPDFSVGMEELLESGRWVINAAELAFRERGADLFIHKSSIVDSANHQCAAMIDPTYHRYDPAKAEPFDLVLRQAYADLDSVIGRMLEVAGNTGNTHVMVVGDHGICINNVVCDINRRLRDAGLLSMNTDGTIDMSRTLAYTKRDRQGNEVFINLRGRATSGIIDPADYERIQEHIIDTLLDWRGPQGKKRVVCFALKQREAQIAGYWGKECGDVIFTYNQGFTWGVNPGGETIALSTAMTSNHGASIQTQDSGVTSNMGMLLAWGPKVKAGVKRDIHQLGPIPIHNIGTTVTALLGCRAPRHASGGIIIEMLA
jgi:predicted AlkP superfamily phosphohydrolase/phosphomutase